MKYYFAVIGCLCVLLLSWQGATDALAEDEATSQDAEQAATQTAAIPAVDVSNVPTRPGYLADTIRVMMRSGPGMDYKIVAMLTVGQSVGIIETRGDWTHIKRSNRQHGWVLSRFVTLETPNQVLLERCQAKYDKVSQQNSALVEENQALAEENKMMREKLAGNIDKTATQLAELARKNEKLTAATQRTNKLFRAFLYGAGVLLIGIFIGSRGKKDKRRYSL